MCVLCGEGGGVGVGEDLQELKQMIKSKILDQVRKANKNATAQQFRAKK